jgi:ubiquitin-like protein Pup
MVSHERSRGDRRDEDEQTTTSDQDIKDAQSVETKPGDADIDSVLDEIDGVLEKNAEEFGRGFVQKGGQ